MHALVQTIAFRGIDPIPAGVVKEGAHFDLPIALGLLIAMGVVLPDAIADLDAEAIISCATIAEALAYRAMPLLV